MFTDGSDNASILNAHTAVQRSKKAGVPIYAIAEGDALHNKMLREQLKDISEMTGGQSYQARKASQISEIFQRISGDLQHTYMLAYKPPSNVELKWRTIQVSVAGLKDGRIRAKEGYLP